MNDGLQVLKMVDNQHYLYRMTVLVAIASLAPAVHHDVLCSSMLPVVIGCSKDRVCSSVLGLLHASYKTQWRTMGHKHEQVANSGSAPHCAVLVHAAKTGYAAAC